MVILTGGIDLSIGSIVAMAACPAGALMMSGWPWPAAAAVGFLTGCAGGLVNGALITYRRFPPILTTLATLLIFRAATNIWTAAKPFNDLPDAFNRWGRGFMPLFVGIGVTALCAWVVARGHFGRHLVAVGGSELASSLSGVPVASVLRRVYVLSGACAGLSGLLMAGGQNNAQWRLAEGWELDVIGAVVIGGVRLAGGQGSIPGAALGALIVVVMQNALVLSGVSKEYYGLVIAGVIILAALVEQARSSRQELAA
jgi:ribose transport system permease protein